MKTTTAQQAQQAFASRFLNKLIIINLQGLYIEVIALQTRESENKGNIDILVKPLNGSGTAWINIDQMIAYEN